MPRQYVHPGPAAKIASQVRQITLSPEAIEALNALIDALLYSILGEITALQVLQYSQPTIYIDGVQTKRQEDVIRLPITTESFRNACLAVCDKSNTLAREALLDSDLILNEWMNRKGTKSDAALPSPSREKRKVRSKSTSNVREQISLVVPPFTRSLSNRSTSTLQSISDAGESDAEAGAGLTEDISMPATTKGYDFNSRASALASAPVATVLSELQAALELILPLRNFNHHENTLKAHIDVISKGATSNLDVKYTTPLLVLYVSTFLSHLIFTIIKGTAGIVEMVPTMTEASVEELHEYMSSDDRLRSLSKNLIPTSTAFPLASAYSRPPVSASTGSQLPSSTNKKSPLRPCSDPPKAQSEQVKTLSVKQKKQIKRLSIDLELAQAHSEIIALSRASPVEREFAAEKRRLSVASIVSATAAEGSSQVDGQKIDGGDPSATTVVPPPAVTKSAVMEGIQERMNGEVRDEEEVEILRSTSSLSFTSTGNRLSGTKISALAAVVMIRRRPSSQQKGSRGINEEREKETGEDRSRRGRESAVPTSSIPIRPSSRMSMGHRSSSSLSVAGPRSRNVIAKSGSRRSKDDLAERHVESVSSKSVSPGRTSTTSKLSSNGIGRRLSEDPDFEDLIMRGDTLRMTLTPSRFRQSSKDGTEGSNYEAPRRVHGTATSLGHAKKQSASTMAKGYSNGLDLQESPSASSTSLSPLSAGIKLKPRAAVSPRRPLGSEDETESSNTERESDMQEELDWDSEDERILGRPYKGSKRQRDKNRLASKKTKESLFDILNSKPPWEDDTPKTVPAAKKVSESNKAEKLMGGYRSNPEEPSSKALSLQAAPYIVPKKFTPIANLEIISTLNGEHHLNDQNIEARSLDAWVKEAHEAGAGLATPSIPDTTSLLTTTSLDGQSDFFSSKASFGFRSKDFPLPPQYLQDEGAITPSPSQTSYTKTAASSNKLNSYKSSPALGSMNAQAATSMMGAAGSSSLSIPALGTGPPRSPPVRRLEAKDERQVYKRVNNDLIDFLRTAEPPSEGAPPASSASPASLPSGINRNSNTLTNGKARLGSVNFRSFMGRGSKRPSTAPGPTSSGSLSTFAATTRAVGFSGGMDGLPAVDEIGRLSVQQQQSRTVHSSLLHIGRRHSESQEVNISSSSSHHRVESAISNSVPPAASLSQTSIRAEKRILSSPALTIPSTRTTMIIPSAHAASPAGKEVRKVSEQAQAAEQDLTLEQLRLETEGKERSQQEETKRKELALIRDSYATFAEAASQLTPRAFGLSMQEQRDRVTHPLSAVSASLQAPLLTPDHSQDDLYHISNSRHSGENVHSKHILQARATSGVDTPPMTPEEKSHSPQFTPLQSLPEGEEARSVTTSVPSRQSGSPASIISASPSTVMPGMAHKHQRTLSAVRRKPSPKVEVDGGPHATTDQSSRHAIEKISHHSVLYEYSAARSREVSSSSQSSGLDPGHTPTPATMLVDEYRGSARHLDQDRSLANLVQCESVKAAAAGQASVRSLPYTLNSVSSSAPLSEITNAPLTTRLNTLSRSGSTNAPSRPPSTVILPLSPRHVSASMIGNKAYQADIHDVLLSMRNNMVCASSVAECLEIVDAALFEYAYDTKDSYAPSIIEEEAGPDDLQTGGGSKKETPGGPHAEQWQLEVSDRKEEATAAADLSSMKEKIVEIVKLRPRTSRYVNRAYDAIIQYYLTYPSTPCILPKGYYSDEGVKTCQEPGEYDQTSLNAVENHSKENTNTPSLYHSVGESTGSIEPADSPQDMTSSNTPLMSETINDETPCRVKRSLDSKNFSLFNSEEEEEEEVLRKPHEEVVG